MPRLSQRRINFLARNTGHGGSAAFGRKDNAKRFATAMKKRGFRTESIRSGGPVLDKKGTRKGKPGLLVVAHRKRR